MHLENLTGEALFTLQLEGDARIPGPFQRYVGLSTEDGTIPGSSPKAVWRLPPTSPNIRPPIGLAPQGTGSAGAQYFRLQILPQGYADFLDSNDTPGEQTHSENQHGHKNQENGGNQEQFGRKRGRERKFCA
ncbi:hypothetical protein ABW21_db0209136 [Orbilia brochopaga]|nr:hypothetical protein ABW21_db0209136 [Drechslerella brochopaga]